MHEDPQELLARLRGQSWTPKLNPIPDPTRQPEVRDTFTRSEVETIAARLDARIDRLETMVSRLASVMETIPAMIEREVQSAVAAALAERLNKPVDPTVEFPPLDQITKLQIQQWYNPPGSKVKKPEHQLKVYVWTCAKSNVGRYAEGTCGTKWMPLYAPCTAVARKRFGTNLDYLSAEQGGAKFMGCLTHNHTSKRYDQSAVVMPDNRLLLSLRGEIIDLGTPKPQRDGAKSTASIHTWYWPDVV